MLNEKIKLINKYGLHTRAAAKLVDLASSFECRIEIRRIDSQQTANCKSIMGVITLGATFGTEVELLCRGADEHDAHDAIVSLIQQKFGEKE